MFLEFEFLFPKLSLFPYVSHYVLDTIFLRPVFELRWLETRLSKAPFETKCGSGCFDRSIWTVPKFCIDPILAYRFFPTDYFPILFPSVLNSLRIEFKSSFDLGMSDFSANPIYGGFMESIVTISLVIVTVLFVLLSFTLSSLFREGEIVRPRAPLTVTIS